MKTSGFLGAGTVDRVGTHSQDLSQPTPVSRVAGGQPQESGHGDGYRTRTGQGIHLPLVCFCLQVVSFLFILKFIAFFPVLLNVNPYLEFSTGFNNFH